MKLNIIALMPLLRDAIDRHGAHVAELVEHSEPCTVAWEASELGALGHAHVEGDPKSEERIFAAERLEEAAMMYFVAAKMLRDEAKK